MHQETKVISSCSFWLSLKVSLISNPPTSNPIVALSVVLCALPAAGILASLGRSLGHVVIGFGLILITLNAQGKTTNTCDSLFVKKGHNTAALLLAPSMIRKIDWTRWKTTHGQILLSLDPLTQTKLLLHESKVKNQFPGGNNVSTAIYLSTEKLSSLGNTSPPLAKSPAKKLGWQKFRRAKEKSLNFVFSIYKIRRPHWKPDFYKKLRLYADEYELESTYLRVEGQDWDNPLRQKNTNGEFISNERIDPDLLGAMRLIREKNGYLPMEHYLGIEILTPSGELKVEPGNFAMANEANEIATVELCIQIAAQIKRYRNEFGKDPYFVTYADHFSEKLYGMIGFQFLPRQLIRIPSGFDPNTIIDNNKGGIYITKDSEAWSPMFVTAEMMTTLIKKKLKRLAEKHDPNSQTEVNNLYSKFIFAIDDGVDSSATSSKMFIGKVKNFFNIYSGPEAYLNVDYLDESFAELSIVLSNENKRYREPFHVPIPLPDNWRSEAEDGESFKEYKNGVLRFHWLNKDPNSSHTSFVSEEIWIDPWLQNPTLVRAAHRHESSFEEYFEIEF